MNWDLKKSSFLIFFYLILLFVGPSLLFFIKVPILPINAVLYFVIACLCTHWFITSIEKENVSFSKFLRVVGISLALVFLSLLLSCFLFDRSSDGDTYHKDAIGVLKEGWNPIYQSSETFIKNRFDDSKNLVTYSIWSDHYAKAHWIIAANFYSFTGNIESGKAMNFLSLYVLFGFVFSFFLKRWGWIRSLLFSIVVTLNPITASQIYTFYNDSLVLIWLFLAIFLLLLLDKKESKALWICYCGVFVVLSNLKFNGMGYLLVFSFFFMCRKLYFAYKNHSFFSKFKQLFLLFVPLFVVSFLIVGYPTYTKNTLDHHTPFFPLYGEGKEDIMTLQQPKSFLSMSPIEKLFYSTFSKVNNLRETDETSLKIPFTVSKEEIVPATSYDLRISGLGIFFSGLLCVSIFLLIKYYPKYKKDSRILFTLSITTLLLVMMNESWWARYTPHFYLFLIFAVYCLLEYGPTKLRFLPILFFGVLFLNVALPFLGNSYYTISHSAEIYRELSSLRGKTVYLDVDGYYGIIYNFKDYHIRYQIKDDVSRESAFYDMVHYQVIRDE